MTLVVDLANIERLVVSFARLTEPGVGISRLAYTPQEREAHKLFSDEMTSLGLHVESDPVGNTIAELTPNSTSPKSRAIGTGSHLDSVPAGGKFDGVAGVCAAIEIARLAIESERQRSRPWRFVAFAAEEGARFGQACIGSRCVAGLMTPNALQELSDKDGTSLFQAMRQVGLAPERLEDSRWDPSDWAAFVELHIEQGNLLEARNEVIGVVSSISGSTRMLVKLSGISSHSGGTPMHLRRDALVAAAECILACESLGTEQHRGSTRVTVGRIEVEPNSITTIPGTVRFSVDIRDLDGTQQRKTAHELVDSFRHIAAARHVDLDVQVIGDTPPVALPPSLMGEIAEAASREGFAYHVMPSGASHDAQQVNQVVPAGMVFVPSRDGLSHVPEEWTSYADLADGIRVLFSALCALDASTTSLTANVADQ